MPLNHYFKILIVLLFVSTTQIQAQSRCELETIISDTEVSLLTQVIHDDGAYLIFDAPRPFKPPISISTLTDTYNFDIETRTRHLLTNLDGQDMNSREHKFSPDGRYMVFLAPGFGNFIAQLYSVALPDGTPQRLNIDLPEYLNLDRPPLFDDLKGIIDDIDFFITPDSEYILYTISYELMGVQHIYRVPINGGESVDVTPEFSAPAYGAILLQTTTVFTSDDGHFVFLYFNEIGRPSIFILDLITWTTREFISTSFDYPGAPLVDSLRQHPDYDLIYTNTRGYLTYQQMFAYDFETDEHTELTLPLPNNIRYINNIIFDEQQNPAPIAMYMATTMDYVEQLYIPTNDNQLTYVRDLRGTSYLTPLGILLTLRSEESSLDKVSFIPLANPTQIIEIMMENQHLIMWTRQFVNDYMLVNVYDPDDTEQRLELVRIDLSSEGNGLIQQISPILSEENSQGVLGFPQIDTDNNLYFIFDRQLYRSIYPYDSYELLETTPIDQLHSILPDGRLILLNNNEDGTQDILISQCGAR